MLTFKECRPLCRSFLFSRLVIKRYENIEFVSLGATSFLAIDTSKVFGYFVMQDINKKEGVSHPFFLNLLGLLGQGLSACPVLKSVFKPLKIFIHFLFLVMTDNDWQEESNLLYNHSSLRYRNHYRGYSPFVFEIIQE